MEQLLLVEASLLMKSLVALMLVISPKISVDVFFFRAPPFSWRKSVSMIALSQMICVETGFGQVAKLLGARAESRVSCAFRTGKYGKMWRGT